MLGGPMWRRRRSRDERGAAAVEFALVMIPLFLLVFGIIYFGIILGQVLALNNGAREAARYGVVADRTCAEITTRAKDASQSIAMQGTDSISVEVKTGPDEGSTTTACPAADPPCQGTDNGTKLYVYTRFSSDLSFIPFMPQDTLTLTGKGGFTCEFS